MWSPTRRPIGVELRTDGTKTQVRRPRAHRPGRRAFTSGKRKQNTLKPTVVSDGQGRTLWAGAARPDRMHDQTAVSTEGIADLPTQHPGVKVRVDQGYQGLASAFAEQVTAPPRKPAKDAAAELVAAYRQARTEQSSRRICVEHAIAQHWRPLQRWLGRQESLGETYLAVAGLVSGPGSPTLIGQQPSRSAQRAPLPIAHQVVSDRPSPVGSMSVVGRPVRMREIRPT
jgi:DDE superfamily endonuclease